MRSSIVFVGCVAALWGEIGTLLAHLPLWDLWQPAYYFTGIFLTGAGLLGLALPGPLTGLCTAFAGCVILLFTVMLIALDAPRLVAN